MKPAARNVCPRCHLPDSVFVGHECSDPDSPCEWCDQPRVVRVMQSDARGCWSVRLPCACTFERLRQVRQ